MKEGQITRSISRNRKRKSVAVDPDRKLAIQDCRDPHKRGIRMSSKRGFQAALIGKAYSAAVA